MSFLDARNPGPTAFQLANVPDSVERSLVRAYGSGGIGPGSVGDWCAYPVRCPWVEAYTRQPEPTIAEEAAAFLSRATTLTSRSLILLLQALTLDRQDKTLSPTRHPFNHSFPEFAELIELEFLAPAPLEHELAATMKVTELRALLREHSIGARGTKAELVDAVAHGIRSGRIAEEAVVRPGELAVLNLSDEVREDAAGLVQWRAEVAGLYAAAEHEARALRQEVQTSVTQGSEWLEIHSSWDACDLCRALGDTLIHVNSLCWGPSRAEQLLPVHPGCRCHAATHFPWDNERRQPASPEAIRAAWEYKMGLAAMM